MSKTALIVYSGGLDTTVCVPLMRERGFDRIVTVTIDVGQPAEDVAQAAERARIMGTEHHVVDAKEEFARDFCMPAIAANADYFGYPLSTAIARPLIARKAAEIGLAVDADAFVHGCTGKGNDQFRIEFGLRLFAPAIEILAPIREMNLTRTWEIEYAERVGAPIGQSRDKIWSIDENVWGRSIEGGRLEDPGFAPPEEIFQWTASILDAPDHPEIVEIHFVQGRPVAIAMHDDKKDVPETPNPYDSAPATDLPEGIRPPVDTVQGGPVRPDAGERPDVQNTKLPTITTHEQAEGMTGHYPQGEPNVQPSEHAGAGTGGHRVAPGAAPHTTTSTGQAAAGGDNLAMPGAGPAPRRDAPDNPDARTDDVSFLAVIQEANRIAGRHGVGRIDIMEDRMIGLKVRENYECPGAVLLIAAHRALEALVTTHAERAFKAQVDAQWAEMAYKGLWWDPFMDALNAFIGSVQRRVTGVVRLRLYRGGMQVVGRESPYALYSEAAASFDDSAALEQSQMTGMVRTHGMESLLYARLGLSR